jgi:ketosteroid isomerase-like protein
MRVVVTGAFIALLAVSLAACGGSGMSAADRAALRQADLYQIDQIERTWHRAASTHNVDLMMSIWAPNATWTAKGRTYTGAQEIRKVFEQAAPFQPQNHWISDTPAYKIRTTVNGDKGTLYFECHYIDLRTGKVELVVGADQDVQKIHGKWLITNAVAASPTLQP